MAGGSSGWQVAGYVFPAANRQPLPPNIGRDVITIASAGRRRAAEGRGAIYRALLSPRRMRCHRIPTSEGRGVATPLPLRSPFGERGYPISRKNSPGVRMGKPYTVRPSRSWKSSRSNVRR